MSNDNPNTPHAPALWERIVTYSVGVGVVLLVAFLAIRNTPFVDANIVVMVRIILSLAIAILGATIPGFLNVGFDKFGFSVRAGGALALFVITFFGSPRVFTSLQDPNSVVLGPDQYPPDSIIERWPTDTELEAPPRVDVSKVTFHVKNESGQQLKLFVYDFCKAHKPPEIQFGTPIFWQAWPCPADNMFHAFGDFSRTNGWFGFAIGQFLPDGETIKARYLVTENIFYSTEPALTITRDETQLDSIAYKFTTRGAQQ